MNKLPALTEQEFKENRANGIGSSEVAAILGLDPYTSPYQLWFKKTGRGGESEANNYTIAGHRLEPVVVQYFEDEAGAEVLPDWEGNITLIHPVHDWARATPDRPYFRVTADGSINGVLECKTAHRYIDPEFPPEYWFCQNQYQAAIMNSLGMNIEECAIAWLQISPGLPFHHLLFEVDGSFGDYLLNAAGEFWEKYVLTDIPPEIERRQDVELKYTKHQPGKVIQATTELAGQYAQLVELRNRIKELKEEEDAVADQIKLIMKDAEAIEYFGQTLVTWKAPRASRRIDVKLLKEEQPDIYDQYAKEIQASRRFLIKE